MKRKPWQIISSILSYVCECNWLLEKKKCRVESCILCIGCWMAFEMWALHAKMKANEYKPIGAGFNQTKWLENPCMSPERSLSKEIKNETHGLIIYNNIYNINYPLEKFWALPIVPYCNWPYCYSFKILFFNNLTLRPYLYLFISVFQLKH